MSRTLRSRKETIPLTDLNISPNLKCKRASNPGLWTKESAVRIPKIIGGSVERESVHEGQSVVERVWEMLLSRRE